MGSSNEVLKRHKKNTTKRGKLKNKTAQKNDRMTGNGH